jgi:hypothetical protein
MVRARVVTAFVLAASAGFVAANCGSSSDSGSGSNPLTCPSGEATRCTAEQNKAYADCLVGKCDAAFQMCGGAGYKSGNFSGPCATLLACQSKCGCGDTACRAACGTGSAECLNCSLQTISPCISSSGCMLPVCTGTGTGGAAGAGTGGTAGTGTGGTGGTGTGGTGGGGTSCAALNTCCAAIVDAQIKMACQASIAEAMNNDQACAALVAGLRNAHLCP